LAQLRAAERGIADSLHDDVAAAAAADAAIWNCSDLKPLQTGK